ncbi:unnamed protein product [Knipowitschia caucasica]
MAPALVPSLPLLLALLLGSSLSAQAWTQLDYCEPQNHICPMFTLTQDHVVFEERLYAQTQWICSRVLGTGSSDVMAAVENLKAFIQQKNQELGTDVNSDAWPVLISERDQDGEVQYEMCWMVLPHVTLPNTDYSNPGVLVRVDTVPQGTVYVRRFGGTPSIAEARANAVGLRQDLDQAGISYKKDFFYGAGYEGFFSLFHHNEIWIQAA